MSELLASLTMAYPTSWEPPHVEAGMLRMYVSQDGTAWHSSAVGTCQLPAHARPAT